MVAGSEDEAALTTGGHGRAVSSKGGSISLSLTLVSLLEECSCSHFKQLFVYQGPQRKIKRKMTIFQKKSR